MKNINGVHTTNEYTDWNPFVFFDRNNRLPKQRFHLFDFHEYFHGLIGYESLRSIGAVINAATNQLKIGNLTISMHKKFPDISELSFHHNESLTRTLPVPMESGDFYLDNDIEIAPHIFIPSGIYKAKNYQAQVTLINSLSDARTVKVNADYIAQFEAEINNFEEFSSCYQNDPLQSRSVNILDQLRLGHLNQEERTELTKLITQYKDVFFNEGEDLTFTNVIKHKIVTQDELPVFTKSYRYPFCHKEEVKKQINDMLAQGIIRPSTSPWCSPIWIVPKKADASGRQKWRLVVDYRKLNEKTEGDRYPLPNITEILDKLGRCQYFSTLDLASGFHQIEVHPKDVPKTAFSVEHGLYEYVRMPFGLKNAPATFQRVMDHVLRDLIGVCCLVYMDDIIVFSTSLQEHIEKLRKIFAALEKVNLKIQLDKSEFLQKQVAFLGHVVTNRGVSPNPDKIEAIKNWPLPRNPKEIKGFLGILGYYRRFIRDFAKITKPLTAQLRKGEKIEHTTEFVKTFEFCKTLLVHSDVLQYPDFEKPFTLTTDASNFALGAVLSQGPIGKDRPVAYASRTLSKTEEKYSAIEKELLAIVWAAKHFRPYLFGRRFTLYTDHQPLTYALNLKTPNSRLVKWRLQLAEFDFDIKHRPGKQNAVADALSRIPVEINVNEESSESASVHSADTDHSECIPCTELPINFFHSQVILKLGENDSEEYSEVFPRVHRRTITKHLFGVPTLIRIFRDYMDPSKQNCLICPEQIMGIVQHVYKTYFSRCKTFKIKLSQKLLIDIRDEQEQDLLIEETHKTAHRGIKENQAEIIRKFYFPNMKAKIRKYIILCEICNQQKYERKPYKIQLTETPIPQKPLDIVHIDIFISQPCLFLSAVDKFSRFGTLIPIKSRTTPDVRKGIIKYLSLYGTPKLMVSDNEPALKSIEIRGMLNDLNIQQYFIPANHSETNGIVERFHSTLTEIFRCNKHKYENLTPKEMFQLSCTLYNNTIHSSINLKPREAFYGIKDGEERPLDRQQLLDVRDKLYDDIITSMTKNQEKQHAYHNTRREKPPILEPSQEVLAKRQGIKAKRQIQFKPIEVQSDQNETFLTKDGKKVHKENIRRIRK